jgi:hypothetical protein
MTKTETSLLFIVGCIAVLTLFIQLTPQETTPETTPQVVILKVEHIQSFAGDSYWYIDFLVDTDPRSVSFSTEAERDRFIKMLEENHGAEWMD